YSPNGQTLAVGEYNGTMTLWQVSTGKQLRTMKIPPYKKDGVEFAESIDSLAFSPDGKAVASGGNEGRIRLWDAETGMVRKILEGRVLPVRSVAYSPNGKLI